MAILYDGTITVATYNVFGIDFWGANTDVPAGSFSPSTYQGKDINFLQWSENLGLQIGIKFNSGNRYFDFITVNGVKFSREDPTLIFTPWDGTRTAWRWPEVPNPIPTTGAKSLVIQFGDLYGLIVKNSSGTTILDLVSTLPRFVTNGEVLGVPASGDSGLITVPGMENDGKWHVLAFVTTTGSTISSTVVEIESDGFTIVNNSGSSLDFAYYVFKDG